MSNVVQFPAAPPGSWLCTIELYRKPDGSVVGRLVDMPAEVVEEMSDIVSDRMARLSIWTEQAGKSFLHQAVALADQSD